MEAESLVRVVRGAPTPEEVAALVGVLAARSTGMDATPPATTATAWIRSARPAPGSRSWRDSGLPR